MRAGQPCAVASDGMTIHVSTRRPSAPTNAPRDAVPERQRDRHREHPVHEEPDDEPERLPDRRDEEEEHERDADAAVGAGPAERGDDLRDEVDADRQPGEHAGPREDPGDEPESPAAEPGAESRRDDRDVECVHSPPGVAAQFVGEMARDGEEAGVRDHAVVGADRLALDVPAAVQHLERLDHRERRRDELLLEPADLQDRRQVREQDPAGNERLGRVLHDPPRFGEVEHDPVDLALVDAFVDVAHLDLERHVGAEEAVHVLRSRVARSRRGSRSR